MTRHDDSLDAVEAQFGADLRAAQARYSPSAADARGHRPIRRHRVVLGAVAAAAGLSVGALVLSGGPAERLSVVAQAEAALAPKPGILHIRATVTDESRSGGSSIAHVPGSFRQRYEQWRTTHPDRWREKIYGSRREAPRDGVMRPVVEPTETAYADGAESHYRPIDGVLHTVTGFAPSHGARQVGIFSDRRGASLEQLREMFERGALEDRGATSVDGRVARRLVGRANDRFGSTITVDYAVDPSSFAPIRMTTAVRTQPGRHGLGRGMVFRQRIDFEVFETLPGIPANERLLRIEPVPGTQITSETLEQARAAARARDVMSGTRNVTSRPDR